MSMSKMFAFNFAFVRIDSRMARDRELKFRGALSTGCFQFALGVSFYTTG